MTMSRSFLIAVGLLLLSVHARPASAQDCLAEGCHLTMTAREHLHEPAAAGECLACHEQKTPGHPALAGKNFTLQMPAGELCLQCHELEQKKRMHSPVTAGECLDCHDPHGSAVGHLLKAPLPELCYECHDAIADEVRTRVKHAAVYRQGSCGICHAGHGSDNAALLRAPEQQLCLSCHGQDDYTRSDPLRNIGREIEGKPYLHGPVADGECSPCHAPHGSAFYRLLRAEYPAGPYAPYGQDNQTTYDLCFECHDKAMLNSAKAGPETAFRTSRRNLHFLHVADPRKGRSCTTCHASHASSNVRMINDEGVSFGKWSIPVNFKATANGGSCAPGCHNPVGYERDKP
jgi:predicted CXXCH cytochrome family protein